MKKVYSLLICLICCIGSIQAQKPFYVHQNDGNINVFYTDMVDSITTTVEAQGEGKYLSYQKIWTADSIFTFDVSRIDSISYVTPATKYKSGVIKLEDGMLDYVIGCDSLTLKLKADTPNKFIPAVEDKLACLEMTDILPIGFAGEVVSVNKKSDAVYVECKLISLTDIFDSYYGIHSSDAEDNQQLINNTQTRVELEGNGTWHPSNPIVYSLDMPSGDGDKGSFAWEYSTDASVTLDPLLRIRTVVIVTKKTGTQVSLTLNGEHKIDCNLSYTGSLSIDKKSLTKPKHVRLGQPLIQAYVQTGPFLRASLGTSINAHLGLTYGTNLSWNWSTREDLSSQNTFNPIYLVGKECTAEGMASGSLQTGVALNVGLSLFCADLAKVYAGFELGTEVNGNGTFMKQDFIDSEKSYTVYDKLLSTNLEGHFYAGWGIGAEAGPGIFEWTHPIYSTAMGKPLFDINLAPTFSNLNANFNKNDSPNLDVSSNVSGNCMPVDIGYIVQDKNNKRLAHKFVWNSYKGNRTDACEYTFNNVPTTKLLKVSPYINYMGYKVIARPTKEVRAIPEAVTREAKNILARKADVVIELYNIPEEGILTGVEYSTYGSGILSKTFTVKKGGRWKTSLSDLREETTYEYRAFVEWNGERTYGERQKFTTKAPYDAEWVDLGLSVMWASHNVGAGSPEGYGYYFHWGETSEKDSYLWYNSSTAGMTDIPDISGMSEYDAATANWGGAARMPRGRETKELIEMCSWKWTSKNGVSGMLVTGPNGNSIFLPAAGYLVRDRDPCNSRGNAVIYPSSVHTGDVSAWGIHYTHEDNRMGYKVDRWLGLPIRPVKDKFLE